MKSINNKPQNQWMITNALAFIATLLLTALISVITNNIEQWQSVREPIILVVALLSFASFLHLFKSLATTEKNNNPEDLINLVSHQLRTPATVIKGMIELAQDETLHSSKEDQKKYLSQAQTATEKLISNLNAHLSANQITNGKYSHTPEATDIKKILEDSIEERLQIANNKNIKLTFDCKLDSCPAVYVDPIKIKEVFNNLIDNAIFYTQEGEVNVNIEKAENDGVHISIKDTGIGITSEELERIFDKFERTKRSKQVNPGGSGLGLYIVKKILDANNASLSVESKGENQGTTFWVQLPINTK